MGRVSATEVRLKRHVPFISRRATPVFVGHFEDLQDRAVLVGAFEDSAWTRMSGLLFSCLAASWAFASARSVSTALIIFLGVLGVDSIAKLVGSKSDTVWRNDVSWITKQIAEALDDEAE
jgi:hypothetical protein